MTVSDGGYFRLVPGREIEAMDAWALVQLQCVNKRPHLAAMHSLRHRLRTCASLSLSVALCVRA
jgi:hypothetical protein